MSDKIESIVDHEKTGESVENQPASLNQDTFEGLIERAIQVSTTEQELYGSVAEYLAAQSIGFAVAGIQEDETALLFEALYAPNGTNLTSRILSAAPSPETHTSVKLLVGLSEDLDAGRVLFMSAMDELVINSNAALQEAFDSYPVMVASLRRTNCVKELLILCGPGLCDKWLEKGEKLADRLSTALDILRVKSNFSPVDSQESVVATSPKIGLLITNSMGKIKDANQRTLELLNRSEDEILGRNIEDVLPEHQEYLTANAQIHEGTKAVIKVENPVADDSVQFLHVEKNPVTIEGKDDVIVRLSDLSDHWNHENTLQLGETPTLESTLESGQTEAQLQDRRIFQKFIRNLLSSTDMDQVIERTLKGIIDVFPCQFVCVSRYDLSGAKVHILDVVGGEDTLIAGQMMSMEQWDAGLRVSQGEIVHYNHPQQIHTVSSIEQSFFNRGIRSWISMPMQGQDDKLWVLSLGSEQEDLFMVQDELLFEELQEHLLNAITKAMDFESTRRRAEEFSALYDFDLEISAETELVPILKTALHWGTELLDATMGAAFLVDEATEEITLVAEHGLPVPPSVLRLGMGQGLAGRIWKKNKPIILQKISNLGDPRWLEACYATGSAIGVPLSWDDKVHGVITLYDPGQEKHFGHDEAKLLMKLAARTSIGIRNFQEHERINRRVNQLKVVNDLARRTSAILIEDLLFSDIVRRVAHGLNLELVVLFLVRGTDLVEAASYYLPADMHGNWEPIRLRIGKDGISGLVASTGEPVVTSNLANDPNYLSILPIQTKIQSAVGIPLKLKGKVTGVLFTGSHKLAAFDKADVEGLQTLGAHISTCIENARLYEETKEVQYRLAESEKLRALGLMTGGVAQDFNNMLSVIYAQTKLTMDRIEDPSLHGNLEQVISSVEDGRRTVRRLNEFAHTRKDTADFIGVDLNLVVKEAIELSRHRWEDQAKQDGIKVEILSDLYADGYILGAPDELRDVLINLITNSIEAMPNGGTIAIQTFSKGNGTTLSVTDTGVGMTAETKEKVFVPFYTTKPGKAGLGLSMGYGVVQRHGGSIEVLSKAGEGTTIKIWLPISYDVDLKTEHPDIHKYPALVEPVTILVVEDEDLIREGLVDTFTNAGHKVVAAKNGLEGFERYLEAGKLDVVFTDLGMPKLSGWELVEQLRAFDQNLPIVILSAWADEIDPMKVEQYRIAKVLGKPFEMARLHLVLEEVLDFRPQEGEGVG